MRPTIQELHDETKFTKVADFHIDETMKFLMNPSGFGKPEEEKPNKKSQVIIGILFFIASVAVGFLGGEMIMKGENSGIKLFGALIAFMLVVLPIHEAIHALIFKSFKASDVGFGFAPKAGMVYAYAQNFPITMKELIKVAVMPFAIITPVLILCLFLMPDFSAAIIFILLIHTFACIGDFALIHYAYKNRDKELYTYDDIRNEKRTYYFEKK